MLLKELHELVESERACTYEAEDALQKIIDIRCLDKPEEMKTKMKEDYHRFLKKSKQNETRRSERQRSSRAQVVRQGTKGDCPRAR